jgi:peroxiredoxin
VVWLKHRRYSWQSAIYARTQAILVPKRLGGDASPYRFESEEHIFKTEVGRGVSAEPQLLAFWYFPPFSSCMLPVWCLAILTALAGNAAERAQLGRPVPDWDLQHWINSKPLKLSDLRGKVVLIRWWTAPGCHYCANTAPALNEFHREYARRGLQIIGAYHHKSDDPLDPKQVERAAKKFGFKFPVAIDPQWRTINRWWLDHHNAPFTSMSFLIDRQGTLRYIHPGGEYAKGQPDYREIKEKIELLLDGSH